MRKRSLKAGVSLLLTLVMMLGGSASVFAATPAPVSSAVEDTAAYIYQTVKNPQVGSIGGEWAVLGLARSGYAVPEQYYNDYYTTVENYVKACKGNLHDKKYTEYSRVTLALTAVGKDPTNVAGYNLLTPLGDFDKTIWQGINGPIWALIALDSGNYTMPVNKEAKVQATREMYVDEILKRQLADGGFSLTGGTESTAAEEKADPDITGMALQALAKYQDRADVKKAVDKALACVSKLQGEDGGFSSWGAKNSESCVQVIVALTELKIPLDDSRFVKNGKTLMDHLMTFYIKGKGFHHTADGGGSNQMAAEQGFYALVAVQRAQEGKNSLYCMSDAAKTSGSAAAATTPTGVGPSGKSPDVKASVVTMPGKTFSDITAHKNQTAIESLASTGIINGKSDTVFGPDTTMTRAEFATIVVKSLGLAPQGNTKFTDVAAGKWYAPYVGTANSYGIVNGTTDKTFNPDGTITKQEAAVMVTNAAKLCGMETTMDTAAARDMISPFEDYVKSADWARPSLAFCYKEDIFSQTDTLIQPQTAVKRCEVAEMLYRLLGEAKLLK